MILCNKLGCTLRSLKSGKLSLTIIHVPSIIIPLNAHFISTEHLPRLQWLSTRMWHMNIQQEVKWWSFRNRTTWLFVSLFGANCDHDHTIKFLCEKYHYCDRRSDCLMVVLVDATPSRWQICIFFVCVSS